MSEQVPRPGSDCATMQPLADSTINSDSMYCAVLGSGRIGRALGLLHVPAYRQAGAVVACALRTPIAVTTHVSQVNQCIYIFCTFMHQCVRLGDRLPSRWHVAQQSALGNICTVLALCSRRLGQPEGT
jgi:hypothetical protein